MTFEISVVLIQTLEEESIVVNYFYGLVPIPMDESAESLKNVVLKRFEDDQVLEKIKENIVGFIRKTSYDMPWKFSTSKHDLKSFVKGLE